MASLAAMFYYAGLFNRNLSNFNTARVLYMDDMFAFATSFDGDLSKFDTSSVTDMRLMFQGASSFNQDVSNFNTSSVNRMNMMFYGAKSFNQDLCDWQDTFPYIAYDDIFTNSGCTYQDTPNETQKGPFCASNCQS